MTVTHRSSQPQAEISITSAQRGQGYSRSHTLPARKAYLMHWVRSSPGEEKRQCHRRDLRCKMTLINHSPGEDVQAHPVPADCLNVSDGGLYGVVPIGYGVAMGQRYTFQLAIPERGPEPGSDQVISQQGVIVRAELLINPKGEGDRIGIGVQLLGCRAGVIPMPDRA